MDSACMVAQALYSSGCLKFGNFKIKSGASSPYYIDLAGLLASPKDFGAVADAAVEEIRKLLLSARVDKLASIELKGALMLPTLGFRLSLPCVVVRKESKSYGVTGRTAGASVTKGEHVLFFDDVVSEGLSKLEGIKPLEDLGAKVEHIMVVVDREQGGRQNLEQAGYKVHSLASISEIVKHLYEARQISEEQAQTVLRYIGKA